MIPVNSRNYSKLLLAWKRKFKIILDFSGKFHDNTILNLDD